MRFSICYFVLVEVVITLKVLPQWIYVTFLRFLKHAHLYLSGVTWVLPWQWVLNFNQWRIVYIMVQFYAIINNYENILCAYFKCEPLKWSQPLMRVMCHIHQMCISWLCNYYRKKKKQRQLAKKRAKPEDSGEFEY